MRFLDYQRVKDVERKKATELFGTLEDPSPLASKVCRNCAILERIDADEEQQLQIMGVKSRTFDLGPSGAGGRDKEFNKRLTNAERKDLEARIKAARSLEEVARLEKELREGNLMSLDAMEE